MHWHWRVDSEPRDPWYNMQEDCRLLSEIIQETDALPTVRIYRWDRPSVSFGRLQNEALVRKTYPDLPSVRRPTGGRAVVHGDDITITLVTRSEWLPVLQGQGILTSYQQIMRGMIYAFQQLGTLTSLAQPQREPREKPLKVRGIVNCFEIAAPCDLIDLRTGSKLVGSAQRREKGVILQQMSVPCHPIQDSVRFLEYLQSGFQATLGVDEWCLN